MGLPSTVVGDHTGIVGVVCFFFETPMKNYTSIRNKMAHISRGISSIGRVRALQAWGTGIEARILQDKVC